jgi:transcriptional regulator with XRE-family HTH domain
MAKIAINTKKFGQELSQLRETRKISLEWVAEKTGLTPEYLRSLESGGLEKVKQKHIRRLGKAYKMPAKCLRLLGIHPNEVSDKALGQIAGRVVEHMQHVIRAIAEAQQNGTGKKKKKK